MLDEPLGCYAEGLLAQVVNAEGTRKLRLEPGHSYLGARRVVRRESVGHGPTQAALHQADGHARGLYIDHRVQRHLEPIAGLQHFGHDRVGFRQGNQGPRLELFQVHAAGGGIGIGEWYQDVEAEVGKRDTLDGRVLERKIIQCQIDIPQQ